MLGDAREAEGSRLQAASNVHMDYMKCNIWTV